MSDQEINMRSGFEHANFATPFLSAIGFTFLFVTLVSLAGAQEIPKTYWGLHVNHPSSFPLQVRYGEWRGWDSGAQWQLMDKCSNPRKCQENPSLSTMDWSRLDLILGNLKQAGIDDVFYTLNRTPAWASPHPEDTQCAYGSGDCWPAVGLNPDGSGPNAIWKDWVSRIASHVNDPGYRKDHAHIKYWEPWNEWFDNSSFGWPGKLQAHVTYAQMLRLTEDLRCVVTGKGTVHNYPNAGDSTPCTVKPIDPDALISTPSDSPDCCVYAMQNFLYCNSQAKLNDLGDSSTCTWGNGKNWGSDAIDVISFHFYTHSRGQGPPETIIPKMAAIRRSLNETDREKPMFNGEGSSGITSGHTLWNDDYSRMGLIPRFYALYWSVGITQNYWYAYDISAALRSNGELTPMGKAWVTTYNWLQGSTPTSTPFCTNHGTIYTCSLRKANGQPAQLVWDARHGPGGTKGDEDCSATATPLICGDTSYNVPTQYVQDWIDITGAVHGFQKTVTIGAVPILLEGRTQ